MNVLNYASMFNNIIKKKTLLLFLILLFLNVTHANATETVSFSKDKWTKLKYPNIKQNGVEFNKQSMTIIVDKSSSPLIYPFQKPKQLREIEIDADIIGTLKLDNNKLQGVKGNNDFTLRIGLVYQGDKKLGFFKRKLAPAWVKTLFSLIPNNIGVSHVRFFNVFQDKRLENDKPYKKKPKFFFHSYDIDQKKGRIKAKIKIPSNKNILGLWINSDGEDTKSKFKVKINKFILK